MKSSFDTGSFFIRCLSNLDLTSIAETIFALLEETAPMKAAAILYFDEDLESYAEPFLLGSHRHAIAGFTTKLAETEEFSKDIGNSDCFDIERIAAILDPPAEFSNLYLLRLSEKEKLIGIIVIAPQTAVNSAVLLELASPLQKIMQTAWEISELRKENERLRNRYEDLENRNSLLEEQTRKLIFDLTSKETLRTRKLNQEKLLYEVSNATRSSLDFDITLQNAVKEVLRAFALSRCLLIRPRTGILPLTIYEQVIEPFPSCRDHFISQDGDTFINKVMEKTAPCDFSIFDPQRHHGFNTDFLNHFQYQAALLVPLIMYNQTIGAMFLQDCKNPREWNIEDLTFFSTLAGHLAQTVENANLHEEKKQQAITDGLTGVANRRAFNESFHREFERAQRYNEKLSLAIFDLDHLKQINDTWGHQTGDAAIKLLAESLSRLSRSIDFVARYGGEEFCLLLPNTDKETTLAIAERMRKSVAELTLEGPGQMSASAGVACFPDDTDNLNELFQKADMALYRAKQNGRNRVCIFEQSNT